MNWIKNIADGITGLFQSARPALQSIPPVLLLCEITQRPGLSSIALASAIISRLAAEGYETGLNEDGSENLNNKFVYILCDELIKEIKDNAVIDCSIPVASISSTGIGGNAGGPVSITAFNDKIASVKGLLR